MMLKMKLHKIIDSPCELGALLTPNKSSWYKPISVSKHYIAKPCIVAGNRPTSGMGYMLTHSAAIKWKQTVIPFKADIAIGHLYHKENLNLHIVVPPCVIATHKYLCYSCIPQSD